MIKTSIGVASIAAVFAISIMTIAFADHTTPGEAGMTKINIYDDTQNGWNVNTPDPGTGGADPVIGFVNFRPTVPGDPTNIEVVVSLKNGAPNCTYNIELVTMGNTAHGGLAIEGFHQGAINGIGTLTTNGNGKGNTGSITVDVTSLVFIAGSGLNTYAHVDIEDYSFSCLESDGSNVANNEYGSSSYDPSIPGTIMHWTQP